MPPTEKRGRVHTSTVRVSVLDQLEQPKVQFQDNDFEVEWFSGTGAGGQHRNKKQCSCRVIHKPTGLKAVRQSRSRDKNLQEARAELEEILTQNSHQSAHQEIANTKKSQVGSGMRGDKVRTIQFQNDSAVDHRTGKRMTAKKFMKGEMDLLW